MFLIFMDKNKKPQVSASEQTANYQFDRQAIKYKAIGFSTYE